LATLLLPSLSRAKVSAEAAVCKSNLRQLALGVNFYTQDAQVYPGAYDIPWMTELTPYLHVAWPENNYNWSNDGQSYRYLGPRQSVYACPGYNRARGEFLSDPNRPLNNSRSAWLGSYAYNLQGSDSAQQRGLGGKAVEPPGATNMTYTALRESEVVRPSDMIALGDAVLWPVPGNAITLDYQQPPRGNFNLSQAFWPGFFDVVIGLGNAGDPAMNAVAQRHKRRWNVSFCDGHVETLASRELFPMTNAPSTRRWNFDNQPR
jgi:prepilin-type processing-associated H-X9-DG protein